MLLHTTPTKCVLYQNGLLLWASQPSLDVEKQSRPTLNHEARGKRARRVHVLYTKSPHSDEE